MYAFENPNKVQKYDARRPVYIKANASTRPQGPVDHFHSTNFISQSKYCLKECNFRIKQLLPQEEAKLMHSWCHKSFCLSCILQVYIIILASDLYGYYQ